MAPHLVSRIQKKLHTAIFKYLRNVITLGDELLCEGDFTSSSDVADWELFLECSSLVPSWGFCFSTGRSSPNCIGEEFCGCGVVVDFVDG